MADNRKELADDRKPWERQPRETAKAYQSFLRYRDMGYKRSLKSVANELGLALVTLDKRSQDWQWVERVTAYEEYLEEIKQNALRKEIEDMVKRHTQESMLVQRALTFPAEAVLQKIKTDPNARDLEGLPLSKLIELVTRTAHALPGVIDIERKSRGEPTDISKGDITSGGKTIEVIVPKAIKPPTQTENEGD